MQADSVYLSLFFTSLVLLEIWTYKQARFDFLGRGKDIKLSLRNLVIILVLVAGIVGAMANFILGSSGPEILQMFYILLFTLSMVLTLLFLFPGKTIYRVLLSILVSFLGLYLILKFPLQLGQNIFMASSLLWVAPVVFRKFKLKLNYFIAFVLTFTVIDIYNIFFTESKGALFSDDFFFMNALVSFGEYSLGVGDFFFAYLVVGAALKYYNQSSAILLAVLLSLPRLLIRAIFPEAAGAVFPYTMFMTPVVLVIFVWPWLKSRMGLA